jgi:hypothetical protein
MVNTGERGFKSPRSAKLLLSHAHAAIHIFGPWETKVTDLLAKLRTLTVIRTDCNDKWVEFGTNQINNEYLLTFTVAPSLCRAS